MHQIIKNRNKKYEVTNSLQKSEKWKKKCYPNGGTKNANKTMRRTAKAIVARRTKQFQKQIKNVV